MEADDPRAPARQREARYRARQRIGAELVPVPLTPQQRAGLLRLGLIGEDDDKHAIGWAIGRLLDAAGPLAAVGGAIFPRDD